MPVALILRVLAAHPRSVRCGMAVVVLASGLVGCRRADPATSAPPPAGVTSNAPVLVELATVEAGRIEALLERSAPLQAEAQVSVLARTQNPAVELLVEEGDRVEAGQVLLRLESDRQKTDYDQALSQLRKAQIDFETNEALFLQNLISETEHRNARFALEQARLQSETARRQLEYTEVRAPIAGTVTSRTVKVGDSVGTGTPIFEIIDLDSTVAVIYVPEQYLPKLRVGMAARMVSGTLGGTVFPAHAKRISPVVEARAGTVKVVVAPTSLGDLRPGMWVDVELVLDAKEDAVLLPKRAIVYDNDDTFAYRAYTDTNGVLRARRHRVVARNTDKRHIEPMDGFEAGDRVVVAGQAGLKDDAMIREVEAVPPGKTP